MKNYLSVRCCECVRWAGAVIIDIKNQLRMRSLTYRAFFFPLFLRRRIHTFQLDLFFWSWIRRILLAGQMTALWKFNCMFNTDELDLKVV